MKRAEVILQDGEANSNPNVQDLYVGQLQSTALVGLNPPPIFLGPLNVWAEPIISEFHIFMLTDLGEKNNG